jgi:hypothetical protein
MLGTMMVAGIATNARTPCSSRRAGWTFVVTFKAATDDRAIPIVRDDGPTMAFPPNRANRVIRSLTPNSAAG